jgi:putative transposase
MDQQRDTVCKTFKYKLKPTPAQEQALETVLHRCRTLYNTAVEQRRTWWERGQDRSATYDQQKAEVPDLKAACPEYAEINAQVLQDVLLRLDRTFQGVFCRLATGETPGYPRFQGRGRSNSFTYPQVGEHGGARLDNGLLVLSKIGRIAVRWSRPMEGTPKTVTINREADGWYACFSCADAPAHPLPPTGCETGIDVGLKVFLIAADGEIVENPCHYRTAEKRLARAQRRVSRRRTGSHRRRKAVAHLKRKHQQVQRQRQDFHHKTALALLRQFDVIYLDDVRVANMVRNRRLATSISDASWAAFRTILTAKAACAGRQVIAIPPAYTSQDCSGCGERVYKSLSVRTHVCPCCGLVLDRDENAALNILQLGQEQYSRAGQARQARTWAAGPSVA